MSSKDEIGNPLARAARAGKIGGARQPEQKPAPAPPEVTAETDVLTSSSQTAKQSKSQQHTIYLPTPLRKWLRMQAAIREIPMNDIVIEALEEYKSRHTGANS